MYVVLSFSSAFILGIILCVCRLSNLSWDMNSGSAAIGQRKGKSTHKEEKRNRGRCDFLRMCITWQLVEPNKNGDHKIAEGLPRGGEDHHFAPAPSLYVGNSNEGEKQV